MAGRWLTLGLCMSVPGCFASSDEVARVRSPTGHLEGVVLETNGGATTSFGYEIYVVPTGNSVRRGRRVATLSGAVRNAHAYGVNLRWTSPEFLKVEYLRAKASKLEGPFPFDLAEQSVSVGLAEGVEDPSAPSGGMLYNQKR